MTAPIFILGCHRSGTSAVAGLLHDACGVQMGELMPATIDNPNGYFEALGVVNAHRDLLSQMERDWSCPPKTFRPGFFDLTALEEQIALHREITGVWAMKDPRSMFLLHAWAHLHPEPVRLVAVTRPPADTIMSIERRDGIRQDRAEAIVEAHVGRLAEIAAKVPLPLVHFSDDADDVLQQVRALAGSLDLKWNDEAAKSFFDSKLVRNRNPLRSSSPVHDKLLRHALTPGASKVPSINLRTLRLTSGPDRPLETHLAVRHAVQRNELWEMANFATSPHPYVAEFLLDGARLGGTKRPRIEKLDQLVVTSPLTVGASLIDLEQRPDGVIAHGILAGRLEEDIEFFLRSVHVATQPLADLVVDVPAVSGKGLPTLKPELVAVPKASAVRTIAEGCGWDHVETRRISPGRLGIAFRKRVLTDNELIPVVTDLLASVDRLRGMDKRLSSVEAQLESVDGIGPQLKALVQQFETIGDGLNGGVMRLAAIDDKALQSVRRRAESAERDLARLRNRRSVKLALLLARPFRRPFRAIRTWKSRR